MVCDMMVSASVIRNDFFMCLLVAGVCSSVKRVFGCPALFSVKAPFFFYGLVELGCIFNLSDNSLFVMYHSAFSPCATLVLFMGPFDEQTLLVFK